MPVYGPDYASASKTIAKAAKAQATVAKSTAKKMKTAAKKIESAADKALDRAKDPTGIGKILKWVLGAVLIGGLAYVIYAVFFKRPSQ